MGSADGDLHTAHAFLKLLRAIAWIHRSWRAANSTLTGCVNTYGTAPLTASRSNGVMPTREQTNRTDLPSFSIRLSATIDCNQQAAGLSKYHICTVSAKQ